MSMKKILMAAVAVTALSAGAASAASISTATTVGGKSMTATGAVPPVLTTFDAYTIANELNVATPPTAAAVIKLAPTTTTTVGSGNYVVTFNITGGTFTTAGVTVANLAMAGTTVASTVTSVNSVNANSVAFNVNVAAGEFVTSFDLTNTLKLGSARDSVAVNGKIDTAAGAQVDGGISATKTIIDYRTGYKVAATAVDTQLTLASAYKKFTGAVTTFNIGTGLAFSENTGAVSGDRVYKDTAGAFAAPADLTAATLTLAGDISAFDPTVNAVAADALTTNVFTAAAASATLGLLQAGGVNVTLSQKLVPVAGNASAYSIAPVVTMGAGYTAPTFAAVPLGSVTLEGTNFYAAWVGDGTNGINYSIRLGNRAATAVTGITVTVLNSLNTPTATTCNVGTLPASGELLITSAALNTCFGAFGRADLRITAQAVSTTMTAKMRSVSANVVNEQSLGGGTVNASAN